MSRPFVSVLDGVFAAEWAPYLRDSSVAPVLASRRATRSSRTPGKLNVGVVHRTRFEHPPLHLCKCGLEQEPCVICGAWVCRATGHAEHKCGGTW